MKSHIALYAFILNVLLVNVLYGQNQNDPSVLMQMGKKEYDSRNFITAAKLYSKAVTLITDKTIGSSRYMSAYNSGCSWALAGQTDSAFVILNKVASEEGFGTYYLQMIQDRDFQSLHDDIRWNKVCAIVKHSDEIIDEKNRKIIADLNDSTKRINYSLLSDNIYWLKQANKLPVKNLCNKIQLFNKFPAAPKKDWWTLYKIRINDTLQISYLVHIPKYYDPTKKTPLYVFLHGGVGRQSFSNPINEIELETPVLQRVFKENAFVILPFADKNFNWLYHKLSFESILKEIFQVKSLYNIDDNKVYIGGHSDGARGAFWFAVNKRTPFAAFFGINYFPVLLTGNTSLQNLKNEAPFEGISGIEDKGFNVKQVTQIVDYARSIGANWYSTPIHGEHGLPYDQPNSVFFLFDSIIQHNRNPFPQKIYCETDDIQNGQCYWLNICKLDTLHDLQTWQKAYNPTIISLKTGKEEVRNINKKRSGAVVAEINGNNIYINTSRVKELEIKIPALLANKYHSLKIHVNDKPAYIKKIQFHKSIIIDEFLRSKDRTLIIVDNITIPID